MGTGKEVPRWGRGGGKEGGRRGRGGGKEPLHPGRPSLRSTKYFETKNEVEDLTRRWAKARRILYSICYMICIYIYYIHASYTYMYINLYISYGPYYSIQSILYYFILYIMCYIYVCMIYTCIYKYRTIICM